MKKLVMFCLAACLCLACLTGCQQTTTAPAQDYSAEEILEAVRQAYGDDYLPSAAIDEEYLTNVVGLNLEDVEEFAGEMCMISTQPDRVLVLKAVEGKGADVETALNDVLSSIQAEAGFYPMNAAKANAAKVLRNGDYVCLLLVGAMDETSQTEEEAAAFAEEQVQIGVNAVNALFE